MTKNSAIIIIIAGILFLSIGIYGVFIIGNDSEKSSINHNQEMPLGKYSKLTISQDMIANKYFSEVSRMIYNQDYNRIDLIIDRSDNKYRTANGETIRNDIKEKGFMGKELEVIKYRNEESEDWNNIYIFDAKVKNESINVIITIRENSPNSYVISFE